MDQVVINVFFSVIMPAYNAQEHIAGAIDSVLLQTFSDWELIIVNDGSTDDTGSIAETYAAKDERIKIIHQPNLRLGAARNAGLKIARGQWITFLDTDDQWLPQKLQVQYAQIAQQHNVAVFFSDGYTRFLTEGRQSDYHLKTIQGVKTGEEMYRLEMFDNYIPVLSVAVKKEWTDRVGLFDEDPAIFGCEDHDYWLRLARAGAPFFGISDRLFVYQLHTGNISGDVLRQNYSSAWVRLKNYDPALLSQVQDKTFQRQLSELINYMRAEGSPSQADELSARMLSVTGHSLSQGYSLKKQMRTVGKKTLLWFLQRFIFPLKKQRQAWKNRLATEYNRWLHNDSLLVTEHLKISPTATLSFFNTGAKLTGESLALGDFSYLNFVTPEASLSTGKNNAIHKFCNFNIHGKVTLGNNVLFNNYCTLNCFSRISIGDNTWLGEGVKLYDHNHRYRDRSRPFTDQGYSTGDIVIGNNVWIGSHTVILPNVTIGDGCVIGANNIIYRSVPPGTLVKSGNYEPINHE